MKHIVKSWLKKYKALFFSYNNGFFELPFLADSPELIVSSFQSMPFVRFDEAKGSFSTNNLFINGKGFFQNIEDGLWVILSEFNIKRNLSFKTIYDDEVVKEYYTLMVYINADKSKVNIPTIMDLEVEDRGWILLKPGGNIHNIHLKNQQSIYLNIYFNRNWIEKNLKDGKRLSSNGLEDFLNSTNDYSYLPDLFESKSEIYSKIIDGLKNRNEITGMNALMLKANTMELIATFMELLEKNGQPNFPTALSIRDQQNVLRLKQILNRHITGKFPSIRHLSEQIKISETKLKHDFKLYSGQTVFQYYTIQKMQLAQTLILQHELSIKEIAYQLGYENQSKFSLAYKRVFNRLPSETVSKL